MPEYFLLQINEIPIHYVGIYQSMMEKGDLIRIHFESIQQIAKVIGDNLPSTFNKYEQQEIFAY
ncbi:hypothetical protein Lepto7375DRAFT_6649 [Leptolyngbya sp. PCC 7375]|nr:hypothetical protein Lepto7375DRAFT_6649 [Leptolyngbya sp. PCC 7375]